MLQEQFNMRVRYRGERVGWDGIIQQKCSELARFLTGKSRKMDFTEPSPTLERFESTELRCMILALDASQAKQLGIGKSELHYLRRNAKGEKPFKLYGKVRARLEAAQKIREVGLGE